MSVLVMSEEAHATLAEVIRTVLDEGYNFFGFEAPQSLYDALDDCEFEDIRGCYSSAKIYRKLYTLNIKAYVFRMFQPINREAKKETNTFSLKAGNI